MATGGLSSRTNGPSKDLCIRVGIRFRLGRMDCIVISLRLFEVGLQTTVAMQGRPRVGVRQVCCPSIPDWVLQSSYML